MPLIALTLADQHEPGQAETAALLEFRRGEAATLAGRLALLRLLDEVEQQRTEAARVARFLAACWPGWHQLDLHDLLKATPSVAGDMLAVLDGLRWGHLRLGEWVPGGYSRIEAAAATAAGETELGREEQQEAARRWRG